MMKKSIILFLFIVLGKLMFSQNNQFNSTFVINNQIHTILPTDSGYILACKGENAIVLVDLQATIKWIKSYPDPLGLWGSYIGSTSPNALISTGNNTYFAGGVMQNSLPTANKVYSVKYSDTFDTLYLKLLLSDTITLNNFVNNSFYTSEDKYVFVGKSGTASMILFTDTNSNFIDSVLISESSNNPDWFNCGLQMGNYYYLFGASRSYAPSHVTNPFDRNDGWVVKTDLQGNEIASAAFGNPELLDNDFSTALLLNNKILTFSNIGMFKHTTGVRISKPWLLLLNEDLSINKEVFFGQSEIIGDTLFGKYINTATIGKDSDIAVIGANYIYNLSTYTTLSGNGMLVVLDKDYKIKYIRNYRHNGSIFNSFNLNTIAPTSDGGYIFGGYVVDNTLTPSQQSWLVKTDSLGCDGFTSCNDTAMVVQVLNYPDTLCKDSTYFIAVRLKGRSAPYSLYANSTLALDSIYYPYTLPLWIDTIIPVAIHDTGWQNLVVTLHEPWERTASDTVQVFVRNCTTSSAPQEFYKQNVEIFPNPASTKLHVKIRGVIEGGYTITMYDTQGKTVDIITTKEQEEVIDISKYQQGIYWIRILGNNIVRSEKVIILKND